MLVSGIHVKLWISDKTFGNDDSLSVQPSYHPLFNAIALTENVQHLPYSDLHDMIARYD